MLDGQHIHHPFGVYSKITCIVKLPKEWEWLRSRLNTLMLWFFAIASNCPLGWNASSRTLWETAATCDPENVNFESNKGQPQRCDYWTSTATEYGFANFAGPCPRLSNCHTTCLLVVRMVILSPSSSATTMCWPSSVTTELNGHFRPLATTSNPSSISHLYRRQEKYHKRASFDRNFIYAHTQFMQTSDLGL